MTIKFRSIKEARSHLLESGYAFHGYGQLSNCEMYLAGPLTASISKVPFKGYQVRIG